MQLRALIKTRRRKWAMIALGVVVCAAAVWMLLDAGHKPTDKEKFRSMRRIENRGFRLYSFTSRHNLPDPLVKALAKLASRSFERSHTMSEELHASGYLVDFALTDKTSNATNLINQLGTNFYWTSWEMGLTGAITCCTKDAPRIRALIEPKP